MAKKGRGKRGKAWRRNSVGAARSESASEPFSGEGRDRRITWFGLALVACVALGVYANSLQGEFMFDDLNAIVKNPLVHEFDLVRIFTTASWWGELGYGRLYRPVTTLSFALSHAAAGLTPGGFHLANVLLHAAVSLLLFGLFRRLSGDLRVSLFAAVLFAAHPIHTEAVSSLVGRAEELAALFALLSWLLLLKGRSDGARGGLWFAASLLALGAGFLAKESAATIVGAIICADLIYYERYGDYPGQVARRWLPQYAALSGSIAGLLLLRTLIIGRVVSSPEKLDNVLAGAPSAERYMTAIAVAGMYVGKLLWPFELSADYSYRQIELVTSPADLGFLFGLAVTAGALAAAVWHLHRNRMVTFAIAFFAATFILASNMFITIGTVMAERLVYLPSAGFCLLAACAIDGLARKLLPRPRPAWIGACLAVTVLTLAWALSTWERNKVWREPQVFFETMVRDAPRSARSHRELALVYSQLGRHHEAVAEMEKSLAIKPGDATTLYNLGNVLMRAGRHRQAIDAYQRSLGSKPDFVQAMTNLGNAYSTSGEEALAEKWFRRGLLVSPGSAALNMNLANALFRQGQLDEAQSYYQRALAFDPKAANIRRNYASLLYAKGEFREAAEQYRQATLLAPQSPASHVGLVTALVSAGLKDDAREVQALAEKLFPSDPGVMRMREFFPPGAGG